MSQILGEVETDARGRLSLARLGIKEHRFQVSRTDLGELILRPVVSVPIRRIPEQRSADEVKAAIKEGMEEFERGEYVELSELPEKLKTLTGSDDR